MYDAYRADLQTQEVGGGGPRKNFNVMDVYTQSNQKYFSLSGIIKLVYSCFPWKLNVRVALSAQFSKYNRYSDTSFLLTSSNVSQR
jgi:hypothetical protein